MGAAASDFEQPFRVDDHQGEEGDRKDDSMPWLQESGSWAASPSNNGDLIPSGPVSLTLVQSP